ncbi:MAG: hypothetical protein WCA44_02110 [Acidobacteriaceae bacterium]|jgi:protein CpxP
MRNITMTLALAGLLALGAGPAHAQYSDSGQGGQGQRQHRMDPDAQLQRMTQQLGLSSDQQNQIRPILVDRQQKMQALWQNQSLSQEDRRSQMGMIGKDTESRIFAVLNADQRQKYKAMHGAHGRHGRGGGEGEPQPQ